MISMTPKLQELMEELKIANAETYYHSIYVKNLTAKMLRLMNKDEVTDYTPRQIDCICKGAILHDIGKLYVKNSILTKEASLTPEEMGCIKEHTHMSFDAVEPELIEDEYDIIKNICLYHHERIDGSGYEKIKDLPLYVQIVSVCDVFSALFYDRVYRSGIPYDKTIRMIESGECGGFSDMIVDCLKKATENLRG